jgi:hypothetical protein
VFGGQGVLALYSAVFSFLFLMIFDPTTVFAGRLFVGWDGVVVGITTCQGLQGRSHEPGRNASQWPCAPYISRR